MKKNYLTYLLILLTIAFIAVVAFFAYKNRDIAPNPASTALTAKVDQKVEKKTDDKTREPVIPKAEKYDVPILMYHYIRVAPEGDELGKNLSVTPKNFEAQVKGLVNDGYASVKMADLADPDKKAISKILSEKKKPIVLTFDDGYEDAYNEALPVLQKYDMTGTFYIIRNYVGRTEYMNEKQIEKMEEAGMEIGSHTLSHPSLEKLGEEDQQTQIVDSKIDATSFCYPAGKYNDTTVKLLRQAGYTTAVTTKPGIANQDSDLLELRRVRVEEGNGEYLINKIKAAFKQTPN